MSAQFRTPRWLRLWSVLLLLGALLLTPAFAGGEDDPAAGGRESTSEGTTDPVDNTVPTGSGDDPETRDEPETLTDWLLWWLTLGLLL